MSAVSTAGRLASEQQGGVLVIVTVSLAVLIGMAGLAIDIGNWFAHKRHLQTQADAGALAAAGEFRFPCDSNAIVQAAYRYSGVPGAQFNPQIGGTDASKIHPELNSQTFYNQSSPVDGSVREGDPCSASMVDLKLTETDLPWFLKATGIVPFINAQARVEIRQVQRATGVLPVAVPEPKPKRAVATFVDESTGAVLASTPLVSEGADASGLALWDNAASPVSVPINARDIGVRIALSGGPSTTCGDPLVTCYDLGSQNGLVHVRGWSSTGSAAQPNAPIARDVQLSSGTCPDPYFVSAGASCTIGVRAKIDFGATDPTTVGAGATAQFNGSSYPLTYNSTSGWWESGAALPVPPGAGPLPVNIAWKETKGTQGGNTCTTSGGNKCTGTFTGLQRTFSATDARSGPVKDLQLSEAGAPLANSFERCATCAHSLVVSLHLAGSLADAQSVGDPVVSLRVVGGSQNQTLDCDPALNNLRDELAQGCAPAYTRNTGTACPNSASTLWSSAQPWPCVAIQTGTATNQVSAGMNLRVLGDEKPTSCTSPNHWSQFPDLPKGDPRIVQVFLTPFGSFSGSGSGTVPVTDFATFYVTGWTGQGNGFANPCQGNGDDPVPNNDAAYIVGHFIKYVDTLNDGDAGDSTCDLSSLGSCVAVLTR